MPSQLPLQIRMFNDRVRTMTQSHAKLLTLTQQEAQGLHAEIFELLALATESLKKTTDSNSIGKFGMDGGGFK
jgi:hypothetical protein